MSSTPNDNVFVNVQTYQPYACAYLRHSNPMIHDANRKFDNFEDFTGNLGNTVQFQKQLLLKPTKSLVYNWEQTVQRTISLTVDLPLSVPLQYSAEQLIFNDAEAFMKEYGGKAAMNCMGAEIETSLAGRAETETFLHYGNGRTEINSYVQLSSALRKMRNYGNTMGNSKAYIPDFAVDKILNSGMNQLTLDRNNKTANTWDLGSFSMCDWRISSLLKKHIAGSEGQANSTLTVVGVTTDPADATRVTAITFSGTSTATDPDSIKAGDKFTFSLASDTYMTILGSGGKASASTVQFSAKYDAEASGSEVTITLNNPLIASGNQQNITKQIAAGMTVSVADSHYVGLITQGDPLFLAMPRLPNTDPYKMKQDYDMDSGISVRFSYGSLYGQNLYGYAFDCISGTQLNGENAMAVLFPLSSFDS